MSKIKALSLAVFAIAAMSMFAASAAQAASEFHVTEWQKPVDLTGEQHAGEDVFTLTTSGLATRCTEAKYEGTVQGTAHPENNQLTFNEATLTARYTGCQSQGPFKAAATVKMNGCKYTITSTANALTAKVDIGPCTTGKKIEITTEGCTVTVGEQTTAGGHLVGTNVKNAANKDEITGHSTIEGIQYQTEGAFCILGNQQHSDGDYVGTLTLQAYEDLGPGPVDIHNGHEFTTLKCGAELQLFGT